MVKMEELTFHHLYQENVSEREIDLFFTLGDVPFYLIAVQNKEGVFTPARVVHVTDQHCPVCQKVIRSELTCFGLQPQRHTLFQRLISHPKLRLHWVYAKYVEK